MAAGTRRVKSVEDSIRDTDEPEHRLKKSLSGLDLTVFGVGVIIGAGIFVVTGVVAQDQSGPAVAISFVIAGVVCGLAALCYAEFASTVPVAGSAYTFSYATFGEFVAWIIGWDLVLEFAIGAAAVSVELVGLPAADARRHRASTLPPRRRRRGGAVQHPGDGARPGDDRRCWCSASSCRPRYNAVVVAIKVAVVLLVVAVGVFYLQADNYSPFVPPAQPSEAASGWDAPLVQSCSASRPRRSAGAGSSPARRSCSSRSSASTSWRPRPRRRATPARDMPRGILGSLAICTVLYVAVSLVVVGMQHYTELNADAPLAGAFSAAGLPVFATIIRLGALIG